MSKTAPLALESSTSVALPLTEKEQAIWDLKCQESPKLTHKLIGEKLGCKKSSIDNTLHRIRNKLEGKNPSQPRGTRGKAWQALDNTQPEKFAAVVAALTTPFARNVAQAARDAGVSAEAAAALAKRIDSGDLANVAQQITDVKSERLQTLTSWNAERILEGITDEDIRKAGLREKAIAAAVLIDKNLLLSGRPNAIVRIEDAPELDRLAQQFMTEMTRRGIEIEVNPLDPTGRPALGPTDPYNPHAEKA